MKWYLQYDGNNGLITGQVQSASAPICANQIEISQPIDTGMVRVDLATGEIIPYEPPEEVADAQPE